MTRKMYKKLPFDYSKIVKNVGKNNSSNNNNTKLSNNSLNLSQLKQYHENTSTVATASATSLASLTFNSAIVMYVPK